MQAPQLDAAVGDRTHTAAAASGCPGTALCWGEIQALSRMPGQDLCNTRHTTLLLYAGRMLRDLLHKPAESPYERRTVAANMNVMDGA